ncbi:MAG: heavy metal translocating P-type ATPase [Streptomycetaceae bacterium]|nr:MAG: heavy metal translocating P-type ATPase [Streptomycetaceae bacterium]
MATDATKVALEPSTYSLEGMTCSACVSAIERTLNALPGVSATVNFATETAHVMAPAEMSSKVIVNAVKSAGYSAIPIADMSQVALHSKKSATALFFSLMFTIPVLAISMNMHWHHAIDRWILNQLDNFQILHPTYSPTAWLVIGLSAPVVLVIAWPIHRAAIRNIAHPTMDTLITLGSLSAFGWSIYANITGNGDVYSEVAATVVTFVIAGRFLESRAKRRASSALSTLLALGSKEVTVLRNGESVLIPIDHLMVGDEFIAKPGERFATDGTVTSGTSAVDNSLLTGESMPVDVTIGSSVIGSSLNKNGRITIRATRIGSDTELARITSMVVSAQGTKAPIQRLADKIAAVFVPLVTLISIGTYFGWRFTDHSLTQSISSAIAVLVIACPCALGLATPVALLVASGRGAQRGIVIRQPRVLEVARKIDSVVLDKTGTLTNGTMSLLRSLVLPEAGKALGSGYSELLREATILSSALSIENQSEHPVAAAIASHVRNQGIKPTSVSEFAATPGAGAAGRVNLGTHSPVVVIGSPAAVAHATTPFHPELAAAIEDATRTGLTVSVLAWDGIALAMFAVGDEVKPDAVQTIADFKSRGIDPWLVTGDSVEVALSVAGQVGIAPDHVVASASPQNKVEHVQSLQAKGHRVLMVGDGINDAAALATADLSIAMGTGTDTAMATADITIMKPALSGVIDALKLSTKTLRVIRGNLAWAFLYNVIGLPIAALGQLRPMYAAGAMAFSSLFVVTNSLRIK